MPISVICTDYNICIKFSEREGCDHELSERKRRCVVVASNIAPAQEAVMSKSYPIMQCAFSGFSPDLGRIAIWGSENW